MSTEMNTQTQNNAQEQEINQQEAKKITKMSYFKSTKEIKSYQKLYLKMASDRFEQLNYEDLLEDLKTIFKQKQHKSTYKSLIYNKISL